VTTSCSGPRPRVEKWEADFGRTFVIGSDPVKIKLREDIAKASRTGKKYFKDHWDVTGAELFHHVEELAAQYGWEFGGAIAGHLIGPFPHERIPEDKITLYSHPGNLRRCATRCQRPRTPWILEIHFVDRARQIGGFFEELLTVG